MADGGPNAARPVAGVNHAHPGVERELSSPTLQLTPQAPLPMLKRLSSVLAAAVLAAALPTASAEAKPLHRGAHGTRVVALQRELHVSPADGLYGAGTVRAVTRFQRRHHLKADGVVGAGTWGMIRRARHAPHAHRRSTQHARPLSRHARTSSGGARVTGRGPSVRLLQRRLRLATDGVFGAGTSRAVRRFQRTHRLHADGIVGPGTWTAVGVRGRHPVLRRTGLHHRARAARANGRLLPVALGRAISAADRIATTPYVYGGGHASYDAAGYDCSGSVSYVLHKAGLLGRPLDSGQLAAYGAPGPGRFITIYANAGHVFMTIRGRRYDTSGRRIGGSRWTSAVRGSAGYTVRHPPGL